ncbi:MAG: hypothetical protein IBX68_08060, partial [Dehalococcoidia bacterium]|nr:hypothetical protein [Dehalococcoidia bacterium]
MRIGIPRGLLYYHYFPMWKTFFEYLGCEVVVSPRTNEEILSSGCSSVIGDICLPVKVYCGHVRSLQNSCDYLFIPSVHSMQEKVYNCPKFIGLPDIVRASIPKCPPILDPDVDVNKGPKVISQTVETFSRVFTQDSHQARKAVGKALKAHHEYARQMELHNLRPPHGIGRMFPELHEEPDSDGAKAALTIAVIGHRYVLHDPHISYRLVQRLHELGAKAVFAEAVDESVLRESMKELVDQKYWGFEEEIIGAGAYYMRSNVDGIIAMECFGCGPDSLMVHLIQRGARRFNKPFLNLVLDEHSAEGGLVTRIEAFIDMVKRAKSRPSTKAVVPRLIGEEQDGIKALGLPNMGVIGPAFRGPAKLLDVRLIIPPITKRTIALGTRNSPEFACLPFKVILGSFIECLEDGADTLFMVTSSNACRMGYYSKVQEQILRDMGYKFAFLRHRSSDRGLLGVLRTIRRCTNRAPWSRVIKAYRIGTAKLKALDDLDRKASRDRAVELEKGQIERIRHSAVRGIEEAETIPELKRVL